MALSKLEFALLCAAKAFAACYESESQVVNSPAPERQKSGPTPTSNEIPVCRVHGKQMLPSKFKEGQYYCGAKLDDGKYCKEKA